MAFEKGHKLSGSRKGKQNKTTEAVKKIYLDILAKEQKHWPKILEDLRKDDPFKYMIVMDKLASKVVANKKDITSDGESIQSTINISEHRSKHKADSGD